jgi:hypothetical protein
VFAPSRKAGHMGATDQLYVTDQKVLANRVPSTHGTKETSTVTKTDRAMRSASVYASVGCRIDER